MTYSDTLSSLFISVALYRGFSRETRTLKKVYGLEIPPHAVAFRHPKFLRDRPELAEDIRQSTGRELRMAGKAKLANRSRRDSSSTMSSNRSSSPSSYQIGSPVVVPNLAAAPSLELGATASILAGHVLLPRVSFTSVPDTLHEPVVATLEAEDEKHSSVSGRDGMRLTSPIMGNRSTNSLQHFQQHQREAPGTQLLLQRLEGERLRREQDEMLSFLLTSQQRRQQQIQDLTQEVTLRRQLLASALSGTTASYAAVQPSLALFGSTTPSTAPAHDEALLRLQLLRRLQQDRE
jgi:hypothetical protein